MFEYLSFRQFSASGSMMFEEASEKGLGRVLFWFFQYGDRDFSFFDYQTEFMMFISLLFSS